MTSSSIHNDTKQIQWLEPIEKMEDVNGREVYRCFHMLKAHIENCKMAEASEAETVNSFEGRVNVIDGDMSPLSYAIVEEHALAITILLAKGVRAKTCPQSCDRDDEIRCPVTLAATKNRLDWLQKWSDAPDLNLLENSHLVRFAGHHEDTGGTSYRCTALGVAIETSNYEMLAALLKLVEQSKTPHQALEGIIPLLSVQKDRRAFAMVMRSAVRALENITRNDDGYQSACSDHRVYRLLHMLGQGLKVAIFQIKDKNFVLELLQDEVLKKHYFPIAALDLDDVIALESLLGLEGIQILFSNGFHLNRLSSLNDLAKAGRADLVEIALSNNCQSLFAGGRQGRFRAIKEALSAASDDKCKAMLTDACEKLVLSVLEQPSEPVSKQLLAHIASTGEPALLQRLFSPDCQQLFATSRDREYAIRKGLDNPNSATADDILLDALIRLCQEPSALKAMDKDSMLARICTGNPERKKGFLTQAAKAMNTTDFDVTDPRPFVISVSGAPLLFTTVDGRCWTQLEELLELGANPLMKACSTRKDGDHRWRVMAERNVLHHLVDKRADEDALRALKILAPYIIAREPSYAQLKDQYGRTPVFQFTRTPIFHSMKDKQALQSPFGRDLLGLEMMIRRDLVLMLLKNEPNDATMSLKGKAALVILENFSLLKNLTQLEKGALICTLTEELAPAYLESLARFKPNYPRTAPPAGERNNNGGICTIC